MARPRGSEHLRREAAFRLALIDRHGDVELAVSDCGIAQRHVVKLLNRDDWLALVTALKAGRVSVVAVVLEEPPVRAAA